MSLPLASRWGIYSDSRCVPLGILTGPPHPHLNPLIPLLNSTPSMDPRSEPVSQALLLSRDPRLCVCI